MFNDQIFQYETLFGFSYFGDWSLFDIWNLRLVISINQSVSKKNTPSLCYTGVKCVCHGGKYIHVAIVLYSVYYILCCEKITKNISIIGGQHENRRRDFKREK